MLHFDDLHRRDFHVTCLSSVLINYRIACNCDNCNNITMSFLFDAGLVPRSVVRQDLSQQFNVFLDVLRGILFASADR